VDFLIRSCEPAAEAEGIPPHQETKGAIEHKSPTSPTSTHIKSKGGKAPTYQTELGQEEGPPELGRVRGIPPSILMVDNYRNFTEGELRRDSGMRKRRKGVSYRPEKRRNCCDEIGTGNDETRKPTMHTYQKR